ncbi:MAG: PLDc N-terminal domain-containing protein, partial [Candidatus Freyarchaeota archaeon]
MLQFPFFAMGLFHFVFILAWFLVAILLGVWVYRDARDRGMEAALWLLIVLLTGPLGLIIYLMVRE